nr:helix-turn-helix domain-containing protein [Qipengyuania sp. Z2]
MTNRKPADNPFGEEQGFDVYSDSCPARLVLDHLGDKWALLILHRLAFGPRRFNALRRDISGISQKVLSQVLKRLERDGLLTRTVTPTVPVTVEYALTQMGAQLTERVCPLLRWAEDNMPAILGAQDAYDVKQAAAGTG